MTETRALNRPKSAVEKAADILRDLTGLYPGSTVEQLTEPLAITHDDGSTTIVPAGNYVLRQGNRVYASAGESELAP